MARRFLLGALAASLLLALPQAAHARPPGGGPPEARAGKPTVTILNEKNVFATATFYDDAPGGFRETSVNLIKERYKGPESRGKPIRRRGMSVVIITSGPDPATGREGFTAYTGFTPLRGRDLTLRRNLRGASVDADAVLQGERCDYTHAGISCVALDPVRVHASVGWTGVGPVRSQHEVVRTRGEGFRTRYRSRTADRDAVVTGRVTGDLATAAGPVGGYLSRGSTHAVYWFREAP